MAINEEAISNNSPETNETEGRSIVIKLRDRAFGGSDERFAVGLGHPVDEVRGWTSGSEPIDEDVLMKVRAIARLREVELDQ